MTSEAPTTFGSLPNEIIYQVANSVIKPLASPLKPTSTSGLNPFSLVNHKYHTLTEDHRRSLIEADGRRHVFHDLRSTGQSPEPIQETYKALSAVTDEARTVSVIWRGAVELPRGSTTSPSSLQSINQADDERPKPHLDALFMIADFPRRTSMTPHTPIAFGYPNISTPSEITSLFSADALILTTAPDTKSLFDAVTTPSSISKADFPTVIAVSTKDRDAWDMLWQHAVPDGPKLVYIARSDLPISASGVCRKLVETESAGLRPEIVIALETSAGVRGRDSIDPDSMMKSFRNVLCSLGQTEDEADALLERVSVCGVDPEDDTLYGLALRLDDKFVVEPARARAAAVAQVGGSSQ